MTMTLRLDGRLDVGALRTCVQALVERHPALRTSFTVIDGHLHQVVHDHVTLPWTCADADTEDLGFVTAHALTPFDLEAGPLVRVGLWRFPDSSHVLPLVVHHMVGDGRSFDILLNEIATPFAVVMAALQAVLCRYGSPDRVTVGTAVDGRGGSAYEHVVGYYDELGDVVPVIPFHENAFGDSWQTVTRDVATILDEEEAGDELVASVESASDAPDGLDGRT